MLFFIFAPHLKIAMENFITYSLLIILAIGSCFLYYSITKTENIKEVVITGTTKVASTPKDTVSACCLKPINDTLPNN